MTINADTVRKELRKFIVEAFLIGDEDNSFADGDSFMHGGIIDSTGILELTAHLEEKYGVTVEDTEMVPANLDSIDNLVAYISKKLP